MELPFSVLTVAGSYDRLAARYAGWADRVTPALRERYAGVLAARLSPGGRVVELGCGPGGAGGPDAEPPVLGGRVDISWEMVRLARRNAPGAAFVRADMVSTVWSRSPP